MPEPELLVCGALLLAMIVYLVTGGADFGGGAWELFARGPRGPAQIQALRRAIAPIWEANHVWLILVVVLLFVCFPPAFAALMVALHVPVTLLLLGIVLRGAAFVFQAYAAGDERVAGPSVAWFRVASTVTPWLLGIVAGAAAGGEVRVDPVTFVVAPAAADAWLGPFPLLVGAMTWTLCVYLAAVYMTLETDGALREDFRRRALLAGVAVGAVALPTALVAWHAAPHLGRPLLASSWSLPFHAFTGAVAVGALGAVWRRRFRLARVLAPLQAALVLLGWGLAQYPWVLAPDLDVRTAAAPPVVLRTTLVVLAAGTAILLPAFVWLFRVFKAR